MPDLEKVIKAVECRKNAHKRCGNPCERTGGCAYAKWIRGIDGEPYYPCVCDVERLCDDALALLREQEGQKQKWLKQIADTQIAVCPTGNETEEELAKRTGEWNGLQMAWDILTKGR